MAVMLARSPTTIDVAFEHEAILLHERADVFSVDRSRTIGSSLALGWRGDPPVAVGRPLVDQAPAARVSALRAAVSATATSVFSAPDRAPR